MNQKEFDQFIRTQNITNCTIEVLFEEVPGLKDKVKQRLKKHYKNAYQVYKQKQGGNDAKTNNIH